MITDFHFQRQGISVDGGLVGKKYQKDDNVFKKMKASLMFLFNQIIRL